MRISGWLDLAADMAMLFRIGVLGGRDGKCDLMRGRLPVVVAAMRSWVKSSSAMARSRRSWSPDADKERLEWGSCESVGNSARSCSSRIVKRKYKQFVDKLSGEDKKWFVWVARGCAPDAKCRLTHGVTRLQIGSSSPMNDQYSGYLVQMRNDQS